MKEKSEKKMVKGALMEMRNYETAAAMARVALKYLST